MEAQIREFPTPGGQLPLAAEPRVPPRPTGHLLLHLPRHVPRKKTHGPDGVGACDRVYEVCGKDRGTIPRELGQPEVFRQQTVN